MIEHRKYTARFTTSTCDCCGEFASGIITECDGVSVFFACNICAPQAWTELGISQKDAWLNNTVCAA